MCKSMILLAIRTRRWCRCAPLLVALWAIATADAGPNFSAILGGSGQDYAAAVATDAQGNVYVAGLTYSPDFRVTAGALQTKIGSVGASDAFVAKFAADGALLWSTYLGGCCDDWATGVAVDAAGNVLVTGWTRSADFPVLHAFQGTLNNGVSPARYDAFVAKLDPTGTKLLYSTFLGGSGDDGASGLAVDAGGNAYVAGNVQSSASFPGMKGTPDVNGIFVSKLDPNGALVYSFLHPLRQRRGNRRGFERQRVRHRNAALPSIPRAASPTRSARKATRRPWCFKVSADGSRRSTRRPRRQRPGRRTGGRRRSSRRGLRGGVYIIG